MTNINISQSVESRQDHHFLIVGIGRPATVGDRGHWFRSLGSKDGPHPEIQGQFDPCFREQGMRMIGEGPGTNTGKKQECSNTLRIDIPAKVPNLDNARLECVQGSYCRRRSSLSCQQRTNSLVNALSRCGHSFTASNSNTGLLWMMTSGRRGQQLCNQFRARQSSTHCKHLHPATSQDSQL
jgi:hypothetical protein